MGSLVGNYEVFLSFRGADSRQGLTDVLYDHMDNAKIRVFRDDNALQIGDKINSIFKAIFNSKICIPIFSPNFVQSKYCLLEVTKMVELKKTIVPIFYNVTSDDVKLKTPLYVNDFIKLEEKYGKQEVDKWKEALKEAVSYKGKKVGVKGYSMFCKELVYEVLTKLSSRDLESSSSSHQEAVSVGIDGMPKGVTTLLGGPVMVLGPEFVVPNPIELIFRKTGRLINFDVIDSKGTIIFKIKNHLFSDELLDASGKTLAIMYQKAYFSLNVHVFRGKSTDNKDLLFWVKNSKGLDQLMTNNTFKHYVYLAQNTNEDVCDYTVEGSWSEKTCIIYAGNTNNMIAQILHNEGTVQNAVGNSHFSVAVYPDIDYAFIVALFESSGCWEMFS